LITVKKAIYIILIMSSMGFTIGSKTESKKAEKEIVIDYSSPQAGYLEVSSPVSYSLTTGS